MEKKQQLWLQSTPQVSVVEALVAALRVSAGQPGEALAGLVELASRNLDSWWAWWLEQRMVHQSLSLQASHLVLA